MFYKKTIKKMRDKIDTHFTKIIETQNRIKELQEITKKESEKKETEFKSINEKIDAIIECIRGDRKDINALINIYKAMKPQTKRKK